MEGDHEFSNDAFLFPFDFDEELGCVPSVEEHFKVFTKVMDLPPLLLFGETYFHLSNFKLDIEFDDNLEHLVRVDEGEHSNVTNVGQQNRQNELSLPIFDRTIFKVCSIYAWK
jgi:hypothetical protein